MNRRLALKLLGTAPAWAQRPGRHAQPAPEQPPAVMDAVVTDDRGNPVRDLGPADFNISEGDRACSIMAFAAVDTLSGAARTAPPLPLPLQIDPGEIHRTFMLVVDDAGISAAAADAVRGALAKFVGQQTGPHDLAAVLRAADGTGAFEHLTSDRALLGAAVGYVAFNPAARPPSTPAWPEALRYALEGLLAVHGRKAVVLFWERICEQTDVGALITLANRAWSSVYPVYMGPSPAPSAEGLERLARETGGLSLTQEVPAAVARLLQHQESYYLLGYHSELPPGREGPVSVKLVRPGLQLCSRASRPRIAPIQAVSRSGDPVTELTRLLASPLNSGTLHLGLSPLFGHDTSDWLDVLLTLDLHEAAVIHKLDGTHQIALDFAISVHGANGEVLYDKGASYSMPLTADQYRQVLDEGLNYSIRVPVAKPGVLQVRGAVLDATNSNTGIAHSIVDVPDVSKGDLALSGIVLELAAANAAKGSAADAVRGLFHSGQQIAYRCSVYNVTAASQPAAVELQSVIYRNGRVVWSGPSTPLNPSADERRKGFNILGKLSLGRQMVPGQFVFQLLVTEKGTNGGESRRASQWTAFTLR